MTDAAAVLEQHFQTSKHLAVLDLRLVGRRTGSRTTEVLEYRSQAHPTHPGAIAIRIRQPRNPTAAGRRMQREYALLLALRQQFEPELAASIARPLLVVPEIPALVSEKLPGVPLSLVLQRRANRIAAIWTTGELSSVVARVGQWLRRFHDATRHDPIAHDSEHYLEQLGIRLERCRSRG